MQQPRIGRSKALKGMYCPATRKSKTEAIVCWVWCYATMYTISTLASYWGVSISTRFNKNLLFPATESPDEARAARAVLSRPSCSVWMFLDEGIRPAPACMNWASSCFFLFERRSVDWYVLRICPSCSAGFLHELGLSMCCKQTNTNFGEDLEWYGALRSCGRSCFRN